MKEIRSLQNTRNYRKTKKGVLTNIYQHQKARKEVNYTLKYLHDYFLKDEKFDRVYCDWVKSGYNKQFYPTIDRINCKKGYEKNNIHCLPWHENRYKQRMELKFLRAKTVYQILNGEIINTFKSVSDAVRKTGVHQGNLSSCLNGKRSYTKGYQWSYENPIEGEE